jgi:hypothetical protein
VLSVSTSRSKDRFTCPAVYMHVPGTTSFLFQSLATKWNQQNNEASKLEHPLFCQPFRIGQQASTDIKQRCWGQAVASPAPWQILLCHLAYEDQEGALAPLDAQHCDSMEECQSDGHYPDSGHGTGPGHVLFPRVLVLSPASFQICHRNHPRPIR